MTKTNQTQEISIKTKAIAVVALVTSVLSLFITAYATFRPCDKEKIIVEAANELLFFESLGNLTFDQYFSIRNSGKKQGIITSIDGLIISEDGQFKRHISAKYYENGFPFINIILNPDEKLVCYFRLLKQSSPQDRKTELKFINTYDEAKEYVWREYGNNVPMRTYLNREIFSEIEEFVKNRFSNFNLGEYQYIVAITKNNEKEPFDFKCYSFNILEAHLQVLNNAVENYRRIDMVSNFADNRKMSVQDIKLNPISDKKTREKLLTMLLDKKK